MADDHAQPLLEEDNNPSWVTLPQENSKNNKAAAGSSGSSVASSPWDQAAARISAARPGGSGIGWADAPQNDEKEDDLPRIVLMMRLGNLGAAALLIFGSVRKTASLSRVRIVRPPRERVEGAHSASDALFIRNCRRWETS